MFSVQVKLHQIETSLHKDQRRISNDAHAPRFHTGIYASFPHLRYLDLPVSNLKHRKRVSHSTALGITVFILYCTATVFGQSLLQPFLLSDDRWSLQISAVDVAYKSRHTSADLESVSPICARAPRSLEHIPTPAVYGWHWFWVKRSIKRRFAEILLETVHHFRNVCFRIFFEIFIPFDCRFAE